MFPVTLANIFMGLAIILIQLSKRKMSEEDLDRKKRKKLLNFKWIEV